MLVGLRGQWQPPPARYLPGKNVLSLGKSEVLRVILNYQISGQLLTFSGCYLCPVRGRIACRMENLDDETLKAIAAAKVSAHFPALSRQDRSWRPWLRACLPLPIPHPGPFQFPTLTLGKDQRSVRRIYICASASLDSMSWIIFSATASGVSTVMPGRPAAE